MAEEKEKDTAEPKVPDIEFTRDQQKLFNGFSENLYGNNWFVLSTVDEKTKKPKMICGILEDIPKLSFSTKVVDGPQKTITDILKNTFSVTGRDSLTNAVGNALGANLNKQLAGNYTKKIYESKSFQEDGFDLEFTAWKRPREIFDGDCLPSSQKEIISYLGMYGTVETANSFVELLDHNVEQAMTGIGSLYPIGKEAIENGKAVFNGKSDETQSSVDKLVEGISDFGEAIAKTADTLLIRGWSDNQRMTYGKTKFNEALHRLDIMRAGVLNTYFIVAIEKWKYELDQDSLGEKMKVSINCKLDQRIPSKRLVLYSDTVNGKNPIFN